MSPSPHPQAIGVHLVGSVPLSHTGDVFVEVLNKLPSRLRRIPDGEPGDRNYFVMFQSAVFASISHVLRGYDIREYDPQTSAVVEKLPTTNELQDLEATLASQPLPSTGYEQHALESYKTFVKLRKDNIIPPGIKFQVSLPTPINVLCLVAKGYQKLLEPFYEANLLRSLQNIQENIPHEDLAIQWDIAAEFGMLEGATDDHFMPFFEPLKQGILQRLVRLIDSVDRDVECGVHLCYGDVEHHHFVEPNDMGLLVEIATSLVAAADRNVNFIHMPVPKSRVDEVYFAALQNLNIPSTTELILGLVHYDDLEGTRIRIESAAKTGKRFAIATECGMGRTPFHELESILAISMLESNPRT